MQGVPLNRRPGLHGSMGANWAGWTALGSILNLGATAHAADEPTISPTGEHAPMTEEFIGMAISAAR
jgi:hypothetical protein